MRIEGPNKSKSVSKSDKAKKSEKTGSSKFSSLIENSSDQDSVDSLQSAYGLSATTSVDALLSLQDSGDALEKEARSKAIMRGEDILDYLEDMRIGLLMGGFSKSQLENLAQVIEKKKENISDPQLQDILNEIDLRARVELAKFGKY